MPSRREFLGLAAALAGGAGALGGLFESIGRAVAIEPSVDSSYLDAEHVVVLMQENRSFDHAYGSLRGVRGFNDPRAVTLPDGNPVWVQADTDGKRYVPFRFDIKKSKATWMGSLPHSWTDQVDARHGGLHDQWIPAKRSGHEDYAKLPLTLGHYARADIPFYYALADAFTVCDQYFCSSLTGTTPNRLFLWTGTIREKVSAAAPANVRNSEVDLDRLANWPTFPERLESLGVSWRVYQNELSVGTGLNEEEDAWLANFTDNPLEFMQQFNVHSAPNRRRYVEKRLVELRSEIANLGKELTNLGKDKGARTKVAERLDAAEKKLVSLRKEQSIAAQKNLEELTPRERALHERAFCTNEGDPSFRKLAHITYSQGGREQRMFVPKGDILHQFRKDVETGQLPTVSWLVSPEKFSDHPSSAWFGAWYIAEVLNILTRKPDVWKKTIFLLTYDENDGYFDHVPPFVAPHPRRPETGKVTKGIDAALEYVEFEQDRKRNSERDSRESPIGLGYRVPMVIASPWSRGGSVCSQVFDHTSVLQFLEKLLSHKLGKPVEEANITRWRRTVCGDLTSSFRPAAVPDAPGIDFPKRDHFLQSIDQAKLQNLPDGMEPLTEQELSSARREIASLARMPRQEPGTRPSAPLPYELIANGGLDRDHRQFRLRLEASKGRFGDRSAGSPFRVQALGYKPKVQVRDYAVEAGEWLEDSWSLADFEGGLYHLRLYGPNGFFREFLGDQGNPDVEIKVRSGKLQDSNVGSVDGIECVASTGGIHSVRLELRSNVLKRSISSFELNAEAQLVLNSIGTDASAGWYDFSIKLAKGGRFEHRFAGRVETGKWSISDPEMGR